MFWYSVGWHRFLIPAPSIEFLPNHKVPWEYFCHVPFFACCVSYGCSLCSRHLRVERCCKCDLKSLKNLTPGPCATFLGAHLGEKGTVVALWPVRLYGLHFLRMAEVFDSEALMSQEVQCSAVLSDLSEVLLVLLLLVEKHTSRMLSRKAFINLPMLP